MASRLANAHIEAEARLRGVATGGVRREWKALPSYDETDVPRFLARAVPIVEAAKRASISLTNAYLARALERQPRGADVAAILGAIRGGVPAEEVYRRPFVTVWTALKEGLDYDAAVAKGMERAVGAAAMDVQLAMRDTLTSVGESDPDIWGYQRVADGNACEFCLMLDGAQFRTDDALPIHNFCVAGDTEVWSALTPPDGSAQPSHLRSAQAATRRWYSGEVVRIETAGGHQLTVTPNHPILTSSGWVLAGELREGDSVVSGRGLDRIGGRVPDKEDIPTRIEELFGSDRRGSLVTVPFAAEQFHGDIPTEREVDVVAINSDLDARTLAALVQPVEHSGLTRGARGAVCFSCQGRLGKHGLAVRNSTLRSVSRNGASTSLLRSLPLSRNSILLGGGALDDIGVGEVPINRATADAEVSSNLQHRFTGDVAIDALRRVNLSGSRKSPFSEFTKQRRLADADCGRGLLARLSGDVEIDRLVHCDRISFSGHVYNLVSLSGWYSANGIVTHNCGCGVEPVVYTRGFKNRNALDAYNANPTPIPESVAVNSHGELGPVLGDPSHHFE